MRVECDIEGIDPQPVLFEFFERVLRHAACRVSLDLESIGRIIVASPDRFGLAVDSIRPGATHTNNETAVAGGKTIPRSEGGRIVSDIVLQVCLFENLAPVLADPLTSTTWGIDQQQAIYVICHEFGHAHDHMLRNDASDVADPRVKPFSIADTTGYYGSIVLTELAACRNSAAAMTDPLFSNDMQEAGKRMMACARQVTHYLDNQADYSVNTRAHVACQGAWLNIVELTKLYGSAFGYPAREKDVRALEDELLTGTPLGDALTKFSSTYPSWDIPTLIAELTPIWRSYAELSNVRFVTRDGTDAMEDMAEGGRRRCFTTRSL